MPMIAVLSVFFFCLLGVLGRFMPLMRFIACQLSAVAFGLLVFLLVSVCHLLRAFSLEMSKYLTFIMVGHWPSRSLSSNWSFMDCAAISCPAWDIRCGMTWAKPKTQAEFRTRVPSSIQVQLSRFSFVFILFYFFFSLSFLCNQCFCS